MDRSAYLYDYPQYQVMFDYIDQGVSIRYWPQFREFSVPIDDGGTSVITISYCPWTGQKLPVSLRDQWFKCVEALGLEPDDPAVPAEFRSDRWWRPDR